METTIKDWYGDDITIDPQISEIPKFFKVTKFDIEQSESDSDAEDIYVITVTLTVEIEGEEYLYIVQRDEGRNWNWAHECDFSEQREFYDALCNILVINNIISDESEFKHYKYAEILERYAIAAFWESGEYAEEEEDDKCEGYELIYSPNSAFGTCSYRVMSDGNEVKIQRYMSDDYFWRTQKTLSIEEWEKRWEKINEKHFDVNDNPFYISCLFNFEEHYDDDDDEDY